MSEAKRFKDQNWTIPQSDSGTVSWDGVTVAILMDIRDELKKLNALLHCSNFVTIPTIMREVAVNTKPKKRKRKKT